MDNNQQNNQNNGERNVIGLVGFILSFFMGLPALICSIIGIFKAKKLNGDRMGFAIAGTILSALKMILSFIIISIFWTLFISIIGVAASEEFGTDENSLSNKIFCSIAEDCVALDNGNYECSLDINDEPKKIICTKDSLSNYTPYEDDDKFEFDFDDKLESDLSFN